MRVIGEIVRKLSDSGTVAREDCDREDRRSGQRAALAR
jgi:hypothetical protein